LHWTSHCSRSCGTGLRSHKTAAGSRGSPAQTEALVAAMGSVGAFDLAPSSGDAALLLTLAPGDYTRTSRQAARAPAWSWPKSTTCREGDPDGRCRRALHRSWRRIETGPGMHGPARRLRGKWIDRRKMSAGSQSTGVTFFRESNDSGPIRKSPPCALRSTRSTRMA
jgi:hypothetical protein